MVDLPEPAQYAPIPPKQSRHPPCGSKPSRRAYGLQIPTAKAIASLDADDNNWMKRKACLQALTKDDVNSHVSLLIPRLNDTDPEVRWAALDAIALLDPSTLASHTQAVLACLDDPDLFVRKAALETLGKLGAFLVGHVELLIPLLDDLEEV